MGLEIEESRCFFTKQNKTKKNTSWHGYVAKTKTLNAGLLKILCELNKN